MQNQKSALGLDGNITALIGYLVGILAIVLIFLEKDNKFVRFHALQATIWWVGAIVFFIVVGIIWMVLGGILGYAMPFLGFIVSLIIGLIFFVGWLAVLGGAIFAAIKAYGGAEYKLPIAGNMAEKWV